MTRGPKRHLRTLNAPKSFQLTKSHGQWAPKPRAGPHKALECLPLALIVRNRLKYALTAREMLMIVKSRKIKVDGKVRTDPKYPVGFMDVVTIDDTRAKFRVLYDPKGRFILHKLKAEECSTKVCRVNKVSYAPNRVPFVALHDGRTVRYPDPNIKINDSVVVDIETGKIKDWVRFKAGALCVVTGGANTGRIGEIITRERHPGSFDIVHIQDSAGNKFATRLSNVFILGASDKSPLISLPKARGVKLPLSVDRDRKIASYQRKAGRR